MRIAAVAAPGREVVAPDRKVVQPRDPTIFAPPVRHDRPEIVAPDRRAGPDRPRVLKPRDEYPGRPAGRETTRACAKTACMIWSASSPER